MDTGAGLGGLQEALSHLREVTDDEVEVALAQTATLLGGLAAVHCALVARAAVLAASRARETEPKDRLIDADEAATRLNCSADWLYRNRRRFKFTMPDCELPGVKFSSNGIDRYIRQRQGRG